MKNINLEIKIAQRASDLASKFDLDYPVLDAHMDLAAAQKDCSLNLETLMSFDNSNFGHDMFGIRRHLNRVTGKIENYFSPRCSC